MFSYMYSHCISKQFVLVCWEGEESASVVRENGVKGDLIVGETKEVKLGSNQHRFSKQLQS